MSMMTSCCFLLLAVASCLFISRTEAFVTLEPGKRSFVDRKSRHDAGFPDTRSLLVSLSTSHHPAHYAASPNESDETLRTSNRRSLLVSLPTLLLPLVVSSQPSLAQEKEKVLVLGGTGFVGSQVVDILRSMNIETIATSRNGRDGTVALDFTQANIEKEVQRLASGCTSVISCVGAIGTPNDEKINAGTGLAAKGAKEAGIPKRFVYITVAPEVKEFARNVDFLQGYMAGKTFSRDQVINLFGEEAILIEPTFIYGGGSFELNPPRVASFYGQFIEGILSSSPIRNVERLLSPGFIKIALEPPVPVEDVARAAVAGALGETQPIMDSYDKIKRASSSLQS